MDTILDTTKVYLYSVCFSLLPTDASWNHIYIYFSCQVIALAYCFGKMAPATKHNGGNLFMICAIDNDLLHASGNSPVDKIEERINFALIHAC